MSAGGVFSRFGHSQNVQQTGGSVTETFARSHESVLLGAIGIMSWIAIWELAVRAGLFDARDVPPPSVVTLELMARLITVGYWLDIWRSLIAAFAGLMIAISIALPLGVVAGRSKLVWRAIRPLVEFLRPIPGLTLIPLTVLAWGPTVKSDIFLVSLGCLWPMFLQTMYGVRAVDDVARQTARSYGMGAFERLRWVELPSALPYLFTGLKISTAVALIIAISAELIIGTPGLGSAIRRAQESLAVAGMYALIVASGLLGICIHLVFEALERKYLYWARSRAGSVR